MPFSKRLSSVLPFVAALSIGLGACAQKEALTAPPVPPSPPAAMRSTSEVVASALPAVVLLINERPAKPGEKPKTTFGAGFLSLGNVVVTSLHVVDGEGKLSAMLYRPGRASFAPMDGGLPRFLFEYQRELVPATRLAGDAMTDLAVLRIETDTSHLPKLVWSEEAPRPGDRVLSLGHPQETVWSFTEGVLGALQYGILQHDCIVGPGSSGGPLLDLKGNVIGVNIARVANVSQGLSFARPISIVASTFSDRKVSSPLDLSTPAAAAQSCWRAQQLALSDTAECFDWEHEWEQAKGVATEAKRLVTTAAEREKIDSCLLSPQAKKGWIARSREHAIRVFDPAFQSTLNAKETAEELGHETEHCTSGAACTPSVEGGKSKEESAFISDYLDPVKLAVRLRNGLRVEGTHFFENGKLAWVLLASRGNDGSVARFTELYSLRPVSNEKSPGKAAPSAAATSPVSTEKWVQYLLPTDEEIEQLPKDWPSPVITFSWKRPKQLASFIKKAASKEACPITPAENDAAAPGGSGRALLRFGFHLD